jgi:hypothetical protein
MGLRSKVVTILPKELRAELDKRLIDNSFSDYRGLEEWLQARGYQISRGSLQRYGSDFEDRLAAISRATQQAKSIVEASPDREGSMNNALMSLIQTRLIDVLGGNAAIDDVTLARFAQAVAHLGKATVQQKRWAEDMRERLENEKRAAGEKIEEITRDGGLSAEAARAIRAALMGINPLGTV